MSRFSTRPFLSAFYSFFNLNLFIMKKEKKVWAFFIVLGWLAPDLQAQQDSLRMQQLDPVVITASKYPKSKSETGKVLTIIDRNELDRSGSKDLAQVLNEQVGLLVNGANSNAGKDKSVYLRGAKNEYTVILIDGIPVSDPSGVTGGAYDIRLLPLDQVERIEILKGSQSTLYGSDAIAGVINIITKNNSEKPVEGNATISYGTYTTLRTSAAVHGNVESVNYRIAYSRFSTDGISEAKEVGSSSFDKDGSQQEAFQAQLNVEALKNLSIKPFFRYSKFKGDFDGGAFTDDTANHYEGDLINTGLVAAYTYGKGNIQAQYSYDETNRLFDGSFGPTSYLGKFNHTEVFGNYEVNENFVLMAGVARQDYKMIDQTAVEADPSIAITSPYVSITGLWNNFGIEAGARLNHHSRFGNKATYSINPYYQSGNTKFFINLSSGFKAPSLYQLFGFYGANPDLKPEQSQNFEAGVSGVLRKKIEWRTVYFTRNIKDVMVYQYPINLNLDKQNDFGAEAELSFKASDKLTIKAFYTFVTGKVTTKNSSGDTTFYNLIRRPKHSASATATYQVNNKLMFSTTLQGVGQRDDLYFDMNTFTNQPAKLAAYALLDFFAEYRVAKFLTFFAEGRNLFNTNYEEVYGYNTLGITVTGGLKLTL